MEGLFGEELDTEGLKPIDYKSIEISTVITESSKKAKNIIDSLRKVYFKENDSETIGTEKAYIDALVVVETMSLETLIKQIKFSNHMLETLMQRFNGGAYNDDSLYRLIMEQQGHLNSMTFALVLHFRNIPNAFKLLKTQLQEASFGAMDITNSGALPQQSSPVLLGSSGNSIAIPRKGMHSFLKDIEAEMEMIKKQNEESIETITEIQSTNNESKPE